MEDILQTCTANISQNFQKSEISSQKNICYKLNLATKNSFFILKMFKIKKFEFQYYTSSCLYLSTIFFFYLSPAVLEWSPKNEQFHTNGNTHKKYWFWYLNTYLIACLIGLGSSIDVMLHYKETGIILSILAFGLASCSVLYWVPATVIILNVDDIVTGSRFLKTLSQTNGKF